MDEEDRKRLQSHMRLAEQLGARIEILYSDDIPFQIAEFARISGVSKIVIGRSAATRDHIFSKPALTEKLISNAPDLDVYIIPDADPGSSFYRKRHFGTRRHLVFSAGDILKSIGILLAASCIGFFFYNLGVNEANIITIYVLGVLETALVTKTQIYSRRQCSGVQFPVHRAALYTPGICSRVSADLQRHVPVGFHHRLSGDAAEEPCKAVGGGGLPYPDPV